MTHTVHIKHLVRFSKRDLDNKLGHEDLIVENPARAFERGFWCGFVGGQQRKYFESAILQRLRITREVDQDGDIVDEMLEQIFPVPAVTQEPA